ncbi:MAG TPA: 4'-phosphopantetheinyl transferase superfamily protein [Pyrinomonadaceae bacterium]|nr:4'-phosphopantetheinyl transferase superfamily protein [Pyrinomonadaceae bacterium]
MKMGQSEVTLKTELPAVADGHELFIDRSLREPIRLEDDEVHVWLATLQSPSSVILDLWRTLAPDEKQRALKFHFQRECDRFIVARGLLRAILGCYLVQAPEQIRFMYNEFGKPALRTSLGDRSLEFNLSHADSRALFAVTRQRRVGIDIERMRSDLANETVAKHFFSTREQDDLSTLGPDEWQKGFFTCWTRKEAFVKAQGEGLSIPLSEFDVSLLPEEAARLLKVRNDGTNAANWSLHELSVGSDYVAALAVEGHDWQLHCWKPSS